MALQPNGSMPLGASGPNNQIVPHDDASDSSSSSTDDEPISTEELHQLQQEIEKTSKELRETEQLVAFLRGLLANKLDKMSAETRKITNKRAHKKLLQEWKNGNKRAATCLAANLTSAKRRKP